MYRSLADAIRDAEARRHHRSRSSRSRRNRDDQGRPVEDIRAALGRALDVMRGAVDAGTRPAICYSASGLVGGDAAKLRTGPPGPLAGTPFRDILARALAVQEVNAAMGVIVAAPTAGGAGVLPAVLTGLADARGLGRRALVDALATAGLIGAVVAERASLSGAEGGCQAETGAAAAMAAGAATEMLGGTPSQVGHAVALAQQGTLGLVCDPLGGLVELPCVFRNATGAAIALAGDRDGARRNHVRDSRRRSDRHDGRDRPRDGCALSRDRRRRTRRDADRTPTGAGATRADQEAELQGLRRARRLSHSSRCRARSLPRSRQPSIG